MNRRLFLGWAVLAGLGNFTQATASSLEDKVVRFFLTLSNKSSETLQGEQVGFYGPISTSSYWEVVTTDATSSFAVDSDSQGNRLLLFSLEPLQPYAVKHIGATLHLRPASGYRALSINPKEYLQPEPLIESHHAEILALRDSLGQPDLWDYANTAYRWVAQNIVYAGFVAEDLGALHGLRTRRGDCSEYAYLVAALLRAKGIPTRVLGGYVLEGNGVLKATEYHNWAEGWLGNRWVIIDAQKQCFDDRQQRYIATRVVTRAPGNTDSFTHRFFSTTNLISVAAD